MYEVKVNGMTCPSCASSINHVLRSVDSTADATVDIGTQTVKVRSRKAQEEIAATIEEAGFPVVSIRRIA